MDTSGIILLQSMVDRWCFKNKINKDDYMVYLEHGYDCFRDINVHHGEIYKQSKLTADSLGRVTMPTDLVDLICVYVPWKGRMWKFTNDPNLVTTVTLVGGVDTYDDDYGEGMEPTDNVAYGYGATGGHNPYYMKPDWDSRLIYLTNMESADCTVVDKSTGLLLNGNTYVEVLAQPLFDAYLSWKKAKIDGEPIGIQQLRKADFDEQVLMYRRAHMMSATEFRDQLYRLFTQSAQR